ncbi:hypothetical protein A2955_03040 [Candidatus Woesebacteria bacterium RIFCSPLOWO2_01_FULL_37_19]|uniref:Uncharacterized protein n=1 Tax=Candidatus Woesebacteria bacterium RIFCSPLOWO2_01_FULL_37_19 TaxID=1802514 RepID=A0A1F8BBK0_9BACT|nr:MAG: hypothetical protein A2955_03040 [Candidatus Woesebacteria bacterium RIFCSPLOWO2_01_FULL_37_19]
MITFRHYLYIAFFLLADSFAIILLVNTGRDMILAIGLVVVLTLIIIFLIEKLWPDSKRITPTVIRSNNNDRAIRYVLTPEGEKDLQKLMEILRVDDETLIINEALILYWRAVQVRLEGKSIGWMSKIGDSYEEVVTPLLDKVTPKKTIPKR